MWSTFIGTHLTRELTTSTVLIKCWNWEVMLATNFGNPANQANQLHKFPWHQTITCTSAILPSIRIPDTIFNKTLFKHSSIPWGAGPSDALWRWISWSTLVQVMACCQSPHRLSLPELVGGWPLTPAESPILLWTNILCTSDIEYNPYISKGITPVFIRFTVEIHHILCIFMCGHQKIESVPKKFHWLKNWSMCKIST